MFESDAEHPNIGRRSAMPCQFIYDPDAHRAALQGYLDANRPRLGSWNQWAARASVSEAAIRGFMAGRTRTLSMATYAALASAAGTTVSMLVPAESDVVACGPQKTLEPRQPVDHAEKVARNVVKQFWPLFRADTHDMVEGLVNTIASEVRGEAGRVKAEAYGALEHARATIARFR